MSYDTTSYVKYIDKPVFPDPNYNLVVLYTTVRNAIFEIESDDIDIEKKIISLTYNSDLEQTIKDSEIFPKKCKRNYFSSDSDDDEGGDDRYDDGLELVKKFTYGQNIVDTLISLTTDVEFKTLLNLLNENRNNRTYEQNVKMNIFINYADPKMNYQRFVPLILKYNATNFIGRVSRPKHIPLSNYIVNYKTNIEKFFGTDLYDIERYVLDPKYVDKMSKIKGNNSFTHKVASFYMKQGIDVSKILEARDKFKFVVDELKKIGFLIPKMNIEHSVPIFNNTMEKYL